MEQETYVSEERLKELERKIDLLLIDGQGYNHNPKDILLDQNDLIALFKISINTAKSWLYQGKIPYSRINNKIFVRLSDVDKMIEEHTEHRQKKKKLPLPKH